MNKLNSCLLICVSAFTFLGCHKSNPAAIIQIPNSATVLKLRFSDDNNEIRVFTNRDIYSVSLKSKKKSILVRNSKGSTCFSEADDKKNFLYFKDMSIVIANKESHKVSSTHEHYLFLSDCELFGGKYAVFTGTTTVDFGVGGLPMVCSIENGEIKECFEVSGCELGATWSCAASTTTTTTGYRLAFGHLGGCPVSVIDMKRTEEGKLNITNQFNLPEKSERIALSKDGSRISLSNDNFLISYLLSNEGFKNELVRVPLRSRFSEKSVEKMDFDHSSLATHSIDMSDNGKIVTCSYRTGLVLVHVDLGKIWSINIPTSAVALSGNGEFLAAAHKGKIQIYKIPAGWLL